MLRSVGYALILAVGIPAVGLPQGATEKPAASADPFQTDGPPKPAGSIDDIVFARLHQLGIEPAHLCSDAVFIRRVYLDVIGTLPAPGETRQFLADRGKEKRRVLIDRLLARAEFADYWAMKWSDLLRVKAEFPINLWPNAAQAYHHWIRESLRENLPYDRFARELLTSNGSNFRVAPVNFFRAVQGRSPNAIASAVALTFMGERADRWPADRLAAMAAFFSKIGYKSTLEWKEEIVFFDAFRTGATVPAVFPDGTPAKLAAGQDPREAFADWLIQPGNPWFSRAIVNRVWYWLLGRGIIHEPDDIRPDNFPSNPELLALLQKELVSAHYDLRHLFRLILNSSTYQLASIPRSDRPEAAANFAFYPLRRLDAEVLIDALNQITGTTEAYSSAIPEPYTFMPSDQRAIALPDGSITSTFLEQFGRPSRDTGMESERNNRSTALQRLQLLNSSQIQRKLAQGPKLQELFRPKNSPEEIVDGLYLAILSRRPTAQEREASLSILSRGKAGRRDSSVDLAWALVNTAEFLYRH